MPPLYPVSYLLVVVGATIYNLAKAPTFHSKDELDLYSPNEHQPLLHPGSPDTDQKQPQLYIV